MMKDMKWLLVTIGIIALVIMTSCESTCDAPAAVTTPAVEATEEVVEPVIEEVEEVEEVVEPVIEEVPAEEVPAEVPTETDDTPTETPTETDDTDTEDVPTETDDTSTGSSDNPTLDFILSGNGDASDTETLEDVNGDGIINVTDVVLSKETSK